MQINWLTNLWHFVMSQISKKIQQPNNEEWHHNTMPQSSYGLPSRHILTLFHHNPTTKVKSFSSISSLLLSTPLSLSISPRRSEFLQKSFYKAFMAVSGWVWRLWSCGMNPNPIQVPHDDSIFPLYFFSLLLCLLFHYVLTHVSLFVTCKFEDF